MWLGWMQVAFCAEDESADIISEPHSTHPLIQPHSGPNPPPQPPACRLQQPLHCLQRGAAQLSGAVFQGGRRLWRQHCRGFPHVPGAGGRAGRCSMGSALPFGANRFGPCCSMCCYSTGSFRRALASGCGLGGIAPCGASALPCPCRMRVQVHTVVPQSCFLTLTKLPTSTSQ